METAAPAVLVIDDDPDTLEVLADILGAGGFEVVSAHDGDEAMRFLDGGLRPAAIVLDVMMPVVSGFQFRMLQRRHPIYGSIPVLVATAAALGDEDVAALAPDRFLRKPFRYRELQDAIRELTGAPITQPG